MFSTPPVPIAADRTWTVPPVSMVRVPKESSPIALAIFSAPPTRRASPPLTVTSPEPPLPLPRLMANVPAFTTAPLVMFKVPMP